jgi:hypothetical protein
MMSLRLSVIPLAAFLTTLSALQAEVFGLFTYQVNGSTVTITDYPTTATGPVVIPSQIAGLPVTTIGANAFQFCTEITNVTVPEGVVAIGPGAFSFCINVPSVSLPATLTSIGSEAFAYASAMETVSIPAAVATLGASAFTGCTSLTGIGVSPDNAAYSSTDGVLFNKAVSTLLQYPLGRLAPVYTIPPTVTSLAPQAFQGSRYLEAVSVPPAVTTIGDSVFRSCPKLTSVTLPSGLLSIGSYAFANCPMLDGIVLPSLLQSLGIGAFTSCTGLTGIDIPASVTSIGTFALSRCTSLTHITVAPANPAYASVDGILFNKTGTTLIQYALGRTANQYDIPSGTTSIGQSAFEACIGLTSLSFPPGVSDIAGSSFQGCSGLAEVIFPETLTQLGPGSFAGCSSLAAVAFLGNAPTLSTNVFTATAPGFTVYYLSSRTGFSSPTWQGYPATAIDETTYPAAPWLLGYGYWYDTDMYQDPEEDGVTLLTAYALDLDPTVNQSGSLPEPVYTDTTISLTFPADSPGVTYLVKTSTDLQSWTTEGVSQSAPGSDGKATGTIGRSGGRQFLALFLEY